MEGGERLGHVRELHLREGETVCAGFLPHVDEVVGEGLELVE